MKNFKVIISLVALLTASNAKPMTAEQRRAARAGGATTQVPTQVTTATTAPVQAVTGKPMTDAEKRRAARAGGTTKIQEPIKTAPVQATPGQPMTAEQRRAARAGGVTQVTPAPVTQVIPTKTAPVQTTPGQPMTAEQRRAARAGGAQPTPVQTAQKTMVVTKQMAQEPVGTQEDEFEGGYPLIGIPADKTVSKETVYFKVGDIFYDQDKKTFKPTGIKKYVDMVQQEYPALKGQDLISKTYEDAVQVLKVVRRENPNAPLAVKIFKSLCAQLMTAITNAVFPEVAAQKQVASSTMKALESSPNWSAFVAASAKNRTLFYNQEWFDLAANMAKKFNPAITDEALVEQLTVAAANMFGGEKMSADTTKIINDFAATALWALPEEKAASSSSVVQAIEEKKMQLFGQQQQAALKQQQIALEQIEKEKAEMQAIEAAKKLEEFVNESYNDANFVFNKDRTAINQAWVTKAVSVKKGLGLMSNQVETEIKDLVSELAKTHEGSYNLSALTNMIRNAK